jgi:rod shape-determining protein MreC
MLDLLRKYRTALLAAVMVLAALLLYSQNLRQPEERTNPFERLVLQLMAPMQSGVKAIGDGLANGWLRYVWLVDTGRENQRLREENRQLAAELGKLQEVRLTNERLRKLLDFRDQQAQTALPAQVITEDATSWFRTVMIDKGSDHGVREGMPVVVAEGVAGRIIRAAPNQSRVLLITDASSAIATLVQRNRGRGVCRGSGNGLSFEFALREEDIEVGDQVITSGNGGIFPKGLPIGAVVRVEREEYGMFQRVEVAPAVDFSRLEEVLVLVKDAP